MKTASLRLGFIGFGHMAQVLCKAIEMTRQIPRSQIGFIRRDPHKMKKNEQEFGITSASLERLIEQSDILFLCVRPLEAEIVLKQMARIGASKKKIISIMAGKKISFIQKFLGSDVEILRAMPNLAIEVGEGVVGYCRSSNASEDFVGHAHLFFKSMGEAFEVQEEMMDIVCALAGSGPGFVFYLIEAAARAGEKAGLKYEVALSIAAKVFVGAGKFTEKHPHIENSLTQIATPGGTTQAGLKVLREEEVARRLQAAIDAAARQSEHLSR